MFDTIGSSSLDSMYLSTLTDCRRKLRLSHDKEELSETQQELLFNTLCDGLIATVSSDPQICLESLKALNNFAKQYKIPITQNLNDIITIIVGLLTSEYKELVSDSLIFISNCFAQNNDQFTDSLLQIDSVSIIQGLFTKWGTDLYVEILYALSNICSISKNCRDLVISHFSANDLLLLLSSTITHESLFDRCKVLLKKLVLYELSPENAATIFTLLCHLKAYTGNWIFEDFGYCTKWLRGFVSIPEELLNDAFQTLLEQDNESVIGALIFIGYAASDINETVIELLNSKSDEIVSFALWAIIQFIRSKKSDSVEILLNLNIIDVLKEGFADGSYRMKTESGICLTDMIRYGSTPEVELILSTGIFNDLVELIENQENDEVEKAVIESMLILVSRHSNETIIGFVSEMIANTNIIEIVQNLEISENEYIASISSAAFDILDRISE